MCTSNGYKKNYCITVNYFFINKITTYDELRVNFPAFMLFKIYYFICNQMK